MDIQIDGVSYEFPALDTVTIGESKIIKRHSGMTLDQLFEIEGLDGGAIGALIGVAFKRADPAIRDADLDAKVDALNLFDIMEQLAAMADEVPDPTQGGQPPVETDSKPSNEESTSPSGSDGNGVSEHSPETLNPVSTGLPTSETPAASDPTMSEA